MRTFILNKINDRVTKYLNTYWILITITLFMLRAKAEIGQTSEIPGQITCK
jgi:hypothetical protein